MPVEEGLADQLKEFEHAKTKFTKPHAWTQEAAEAWLPTLTNGLTGVLKSRADFIATIAPKGENALKGSAVQLSLLHGFYPLIIRLDREILALCILQGALQNIGENQQTIAERVGENICTECFRKNLFKGQPSAAAIKKRYKDKARTGRWVVLKKIYETGDWSTEQTKAVGYWGIAQLLEFLPQAFIPTERELRDRPGHEDCISMTDKGREHIDENIEALVGKNPVWLPTPKEPGKWEGWNKGGTAERQLDGLSTIISSANKAQKHAMQKAIREGGARPAIDALNSLQRVPWTINKQVLDVLAVCSVQKLPIKGIEQKKTADRLKLSIDLETAKEMAAHERFWVPMNTDWRGRVYGVPTFNFLRDDRVRALFLFADGKPIGEEGLYWLKVHTANRGDFGKISKQSFNERVKWVNENIDGIEKVATDPLNFQWWHKADKPFQFLAACIELCGALSALSDGVPFISRLPVSFDGACSGLQHLSAMTRDEDTAKLVNLLPNPKPDDIYTMVGNAVSAAIKLDASANGKDAPVARLWKQYLKKTDSRKLVKSGVMTFAYGVSRNGIRDQLREDVMNELTEKVKDGELKEHPFGDKDMRFNAAKYLALRVYKETKRRVKRPAEAMKFLKRLANVLTDHGTYLEWDTPSGFPLVNCYYKRRNEQVRLFMSNIGVYRRPTMTIEDENQLDDEGRARRGIAPNLVHACDAAHLALTVNAAVSEGITSIATVHDCFGCLAAQAGRFREIIREQFVKMYEGNAVLAKVFDDARKQLDKVKRKPATALLSEKMEKKPVTLPESPPGYGAFKIEEVLKADYAFS